MPGPIDLDARRDARTPDEVPDRKKLTLFRLNGEDYKVEARPPAVLGLRYLDDLNRLGEEHAVARLLPALLGESAWQALLSYEDLSNEELEAVVGAASALVMGSLEGNAIGGPLDDGPTASGGSPSS